MRCGIVELVNKSNLKFKLNFGIEKAAENGLRDIARGLQLAIGYVDEEQVYVPENFVESRKQAYWAHEKNSMRSWIRCSECDHKIEDNIWGDMFPTDSCPGCGAIMVGYVEKDGMLKKFKEEKKPA